MKKLIIIGAGGHGRVVADIAGLSGKYREIAFLDDGSPQIPPQYPVIGTTADCTHWAGEWDFFVAIGDADVRARLADAVLKLGGELATLIHPNAVIGSQTVIGAGSVVMAGGIVNNHVVLGEGVIVNTAATVDHDCVIGDYTHVAPGAHLTGGITIGKRCLVGAGSTVTNHISVCDSCLLAAGTVVIHDITESGTYAGVPARRLEGKNI